jgi:predicted DNA-binding protein with PD1-like motif
MRSERIDSDTFVLVFETGDEALAGLTAFAKGNRLTAAHLSGIGAFSDVTLGWFDWQAKEYRRIPLEEQVEVVSLLGDVALNDGEPVVHAHVVVAGPDGIARGGHLLAGHVRPTLEVVLTTSPAALRKRHDSESGLALIDLSGDGGPTP